jgi:hypothetical protein
MSKISPVEEKDKHEASEISENSESNEIVVDLNECYEVAYWTSAFGISEREMRAAVAKVGASASNLRMEQANQQRPPLTDWGLATR